MYSRINVGFAVASDRSLFVPTIFDADLQPIASIANESRRLSESVRKGAIMPSELSGGTFTISNLGMYGMTAISPIINMPQAAILGVGKAQETPFRVEDGLGFRTIMTLTLNCDHRILFGADAAIFLTEVKKLLESPLGLFL